MMKKTTNFTSVISFLKLTLSNGLCQAWRGHEMESKAAEVHSFRYDRIAKRERYKKVPKTLRKGITLQLALSNITVHMHNIVHRDIKP